MNVNKLLVDDILKQDFFRRHGLGFNIQKSLNRIDFLRFKDLVRKIKFCDVKKIFKELFIQKCVQKEYY